jgi:hypothetical protein
MTARLDALPQEVFVRLWNGAASLDEVVAAVKAAAGGPVPRWAVRARALALQRRGIELKSFPVGVGREQGSPG